MAYDEGLTERMRAVLLPRAPEEKKMFGGLGFMLDGNMAFTASSTGGLMVRINPDDGDRFTAKFGVERFEMKGRRMNGWLHIDPVQLASDEVLSEWLSVGLDFAATLPPK